MEQKQKEKRRAPKAPVKTDDPVATEMPTENKPDPKGNDEPIHDWSKVERIALMARDELGNIMGITVLHKSNILNFFYNAIKHCMEISLKTYQEQGVTRVVPVQNELVQHGKTVKQSSYTTREIYQQQGGNDTLVLQEEGEMRMVWEWLAVEGCPWSVIMDLRQNMLEKIELAKAEADKREKEEAMKREQEEKLKQQGNGQHPAGTILDETGTPVDTKGLHAVE